MCYIQLNSDHFELAVVDLSHMFRLIVLLELHINLRKSSMQLAQPFSEYLVATNSGPTIVILCDNVVSETRLNR